MTDYLSPELASSALVLIDVQNDFLDGGASPVPGTSAVLPALERLVDAYRRAGLLIVHVIRLYEPGGSDVDAVRRARIEEGENIVAPGTAGADIPSALLPRGSHLDPDLLLAGGAQEVGDREIVLYKPRWSAFHRTRLEEILREAGASTVVVAGCNLPNCPRATLFDATERDLRAVLVGDAVSRTTPERLADLEAIGVRILDVDGVTAGIGV